MAKVFEVFTETYEEVHGCKPKGQGVWSFFIVSTRGTDFNEPLTYHGTYSQALLAAKREARSTVGGVTGLIVAP